MCAKRGALHGWGEPKIAIEATTLEGMMSELIRPYETPGMSDEALD